MRLTQELLDQLMSEDWIRFRYGRPHLSAGADLDDGESTERAARSSLAASYRLTDQVVPEAFSRLLDAMLARHRSVRDSVLSRLTEGTCLLAPTDATVESLNSVSYARGGGWDSGNNFRRDVA